MLVRCALLLNRIVAHRDLSRGVSRCVLLFVYCGCLLNVAMCCFVLCVAS